MKCTAKTVSGATAEIDVEPTDTLAELKVRGAFTPYARTRWRTSCLENLCRPLIFDKKAERSERQSCKRSCYFALAVRIRGALVVADFAQCLAPQTPHTVRVASAQF